MKRLNLGILFWTSLSLIQTSLLGLQPPPFRRPWTVVLKSLIPPVVAIQSYFLLFPPLPHAKAQESVAISSTPNDNIITPRMKIIRASNNILASPVFETFRKIDQLDADDSTSTSNKAILLVPVLSIYDEMNGCKSAFHEAITAASSGKLNAQMLGCLKTLESSTYEPAVFKKIFNRYADNIYYVDASRANVYLAGGALPDNRQTEQYLLRNEILTDIQTIKEDIRFYLKEQEEGKVGPEDLKQSADDVDEDLTKCIESLQAYLALADPADVALAKEVLASAGSSR